MVLHRFTHLLTHSLNHSLIRSLEVFILFRRRAGQPKESPCHKEQDTSEISEVDQLVNLLWRKLQQTNGTPSIHSLTQSPTQSPTQSLIHPLNHSPTRSITHSITLTHSVADWQFSSFSRAELDSLKNIRVNKE